MPATAFFRSSPFRKIRDGIASGFSRVARFERSNRRADILSNSVADVADVRRQRVEWLQRSRVRALERDVEVRQKRVVGGFECRARTGGGGRRGARSLAAELRDRGCPPALLDLHPFPL